MNIVLDELSDPLLLAGFENHMNEDLVHVAFEQVVVVDDVSFFLLGTCRKSQVSVTYRPNVLYFFSFYREYIFMFPTSK